MADCIVYGAEFFNAFKAVLESLKQTVITVLNCEYDLSDISKLVQLSFEINTEIERTGKTLEKLTQDYLQRKIHVCCNQPNCQKQADDDCEVPKVNTAAKDNAIATNCVPKDHVATVAQLENKLEITESFDGCVNILDIEKKLENERQRNNRLESELEQMRIIHEDRWTKMEDRVRQGHKQYHILSLDCHNSQANSHACKYCKLPTPPPPPPPPPHPQQNYRKFTVHYPA